MFCSGHNVLGIWKTVVTHRHTQVELVSFIQTTNYVKYELLVYIFICAKTYRQLYPRSTPSVIFLDVIID